MADVSVRPETIDVEQIMQQLRARIRERRGADYTEPELQQLAAARLDRLLDPRGQRAKPAEQFLRQRTPDPEIPTYEFEDNTIFATHRGLLSGLRTLLKPILKLFVNPDPISRALHLQARINAEFQRRFQQRAERDPLIEDVIRGLVIEVTRASLEVQSLKLRLESLSTRLDFDERRARSRETPATPPNRGPSPSPSPEPTRSAGEESPGPARTDAAPGAATTGPGGGERRRRRRRRRRRGSSAPTQPGWGPTPQDSAADAGASGETAGADAPDEDDDAGSFEAADENAAPDSDEP